MSASKSLWVVLLLLAAMVPSIADSSMLPDYRNVAKKANLRKCDSDTTHVTMYRSADYYVTEAITGSGTWFIMMYTNTGEAYFLMQAAGSSDRTELSREKWFENIEAAAPNYFRHIRGMPNSDCYVAERYF